MQCYDGETAATYRPQPVAAVLSDDSQLPDRIARPYRRQHHLLEARGVALRIELLHHLRSRLQLEP